jgi:ABC-2 type transport system ATP-binding protein
MQQRLSIACALVGDPRILLLDEPTLGLDFESSEMIKTEIRRLARNEGKAVLLTTHQMELAQALADRVGIISHGRLVALDPLERLRHLFAFGQYEVHLNGALPAEKRTALQRWESSVRESDGQTSVIVALDDPHHLYTLLEAVRPCPIAYVKRVEPDLAEIYLKVLEKEAPNGRLAGVDR